MSANKSSKPTKQDVARQKQIEERTKGENVELEHPQGKERFEKAIKRALKKKKS